MIGLRYFRIYDSKVDWEKEIFSYIGNNKHSITIINNNIIKVTI